MMVQNNLANRTNKLNFRKSEPKPKVQGQSKEELNFDVIKASGETFMKMQNVNYSRQRH